VAQRVGRGVALLFHDRSTRRGWVVSSTPRLHLTSGIDQVHILQEAGWTSGPAWTGGKSRPHRDSIPDVSARSSVAIPTELPGPPNNKYYIIKIHGFYINNNSSHCSQKTNKISHDAKGHGSSQHPQICLTLILLTWRVWWAPNNASKWQMGFNSAFHHHHHVREGLGVFPVLWSSRWSWSLHLFLGRPLILRPFGLYCSACFGSLFVSILCTCCCHFFWYCFISFTKLGFYSVNFRYF